LEVKFEEIGLNGDTGYEIRDLWEHKDIGTFKGTYKIGTLRAHASQTLMIKERKDDRKQEEL